MSWLSVFFKKDSVKKIIEMDKSVLRMLLGHAADKLQDVARQEVANAEASGLTGTEKYELAYKNIKKRFPEIRDSFINYAIETAVLALLAAKR